MLRARLDEFIVSIGSYGMTEQGRKQDGYCTSDAPTSIGFRFLFYFVSLKKEGYKRRSLERAVPKRHKMRRSVEKAASLPLLRPTRQNISPPARGSL